MRSFMTLGAATLALAFAAPALAQTTAPTGAAPTDTAPTSAPPSTADAAAPASATASGTASAQTEAVAAGQSVKDSTGAVIGSVAEVKPDATGKSMATIKMGEKAFAVDVANLAVRDGATVINATKAEIEGMLAKK